MTTSAKRRIYIEATALARTNRTGVDYLAEGLITPLVANNPDVDFIFFRFATDGEKLHIIGKNVREVLITKIPAKLYRLLLVAGIAPRLEWLIGEGNITDVIFPNFYAWPIQTKSARIYPMVPDTAFFDLPQYVEHSYHRRLLYTGVRSSVRAAEQVLTCSEASSKSIQKHFGVLPEHISVLYPGYTKYKPVKSNKRPVSGDYILFISTLEPRKNVAALIQAYIALPAPLKAKYQLVLAGGKGWLDEGIQELVRKYIDDGVLSLGYVDEATKATLYEHATVFAYPALYEGFGMPIVEAQAHGVPVLTASNTSLPEAAGDAAVYCGTDAQSITKGLQKLLNDAPLRKRLAAAGRKHAATFSWSRSVKALQNLMQLG